MIVIHMAIYIRHDDIHDVVQEVTPNLSRIHPVLYEMNHTSNTKFIRYVISHFSLFCCGCSIGKWMIISY